MSKIKLTPEDALEFVKFLDIEAENLEGAKTNFQGKYFTPDNFFETKAGTDWSGKLHGVWNNNVKKIFTKFGITIPDETLKTKKDVLEIVEAGLEVYAQANNVTLEEEKKKHGTNESEAVKKLQEQIGSLNAKIPQYEEQIATYKTKVSEIETNSQKQIRENKLNGLKQNLWNTFKFKPATEYKSANDAKLIQDGFKTNFDKNFIIEFDENDKEIIKTPDGKLIPNPDKAAAFLTPQEVLVMEGVKAGVMSINPRSDQRVPAGGLGNGWGKHEPTTPADPNKPKTFIHPNAIKGTSLETKN